MVKRLTIIRMRQKWLNSEFFVFEVENYVECLFVSFAKLYRKTLHDRVSDASGDGEGHTVSRWNNGQVSKLQG